MLSGNLAYKSKPQTCTAHGAAAGFVHTVEGIKDFFLIFRGDTDACVSYLQDCRFCRMNAYSNGTGRPVIFDRIFNQIIDCPVQKDIAACNSTVTFCLNKPDLMFVCNRVQIAENLFCECCKGNSVRTLYCLKTCHVQQDFRKMGKPSGLFLKHGEKSVVFLGCVFRFFVKNFQICLHYS